MKYITKLLGLLLASIVLAACGGGSKPVEMVKVYRVTTESKNIGLPYKLIKNYYDVNGFLIRKELDKDGNGIIDEYDNYNTYTYDKRGRLLTRSLHKSNGDVHRVYTLNEYGDIVKSTRLGAGADIYATDTIVFTYDADGRKLKRTYDLYNNGTDDSIATYYYEGRKELRVTHVDATNKIRKIYISTYGDKGDLVRRDVTKLLTNAIVEESATYADMYAFIGEGGDNLNPKLSWVYDYTYENGNLVMKVGKVA